MKKITTSTFVILFILLALNSCSMICEKGRGKVVTQTRTVATFDKIDIDGQAEVFLTQGLEPSVKVTIDSNLVEYIKTDVSGSKLKISESKCIKEISEFKIYITASSLAQLVVSGAVQLKCDSTFRTNKLKIETDNSGEISLNADAENIDILTKGSGLLKMTGRAANLDIELKGAGSIQALGLYAKNVDFDVKGAGTCEINVSEKLTGEVSSNGKLYYQGNPKKVQTNNTGTGIIQTKQ